MLTPGSGRLDPDPVSAAELARLDSLIEAWLDRQGAENPSVASVERVEGARRWYVRLEGEEKSVFSALFTLSERTLQYESHLMPSPEEERARLFEHLLRRNRGLYGLALAIDDDGIFLQGRLDLRHLDESELDRVLGSLYAATEQFFRPAMRIGFGSEFRG